MADWHDCRPEPPLDAACWSPSGGGAREPIQSPPWASAPRLHFVPDHAEVESLAAKLRRDLFGVLPHEPLDPVEACRRLGIEIVPATLAERGRLPGLLRPAHDNAFFIEVDETPRAGWSELQADLEAEVRRHRFRFILVHELVHTLFYAPGQGRPRRLTHGGAAEEKFCDRLAGALLVPPHLARQKPIHPASVVELHEEFDVSVEVAARSLLDAYGNEPLCWILLVGNGELRVQWRPPNAMAAFRPWDTLEEFAAEAEQHSRQWFGTSSLRWRNGDVGTAHAVFLPQRSQMVVTAPPRSTGHGSRVLAG